LVQAQVRLVRLSIGRTVGAKDIGHLQCGAFHERGSGWLQLIQRADHLAQ